MDLKPLDLLTAISICREIEQVLIPLGYHCALGGGCLHQAGLRKDCDVMIYPHDINKTDNPSHEKILEALKPIGIGSCENEASATDKEVRVGNWKQLHRLDMFFFTK